MFLWLTVYNTSTCMCEHWQVTSN